MIMIIGGLLMAAAGILVTLFPPKSINSLYGYGRNALWRMNPSGEKATVSVRSS
ncbi:hypothetical protein BUN12_4050 [Bacillus amyloliquefaciens]|jgi:uncharacterized membrane protein|nr:hypothetical protein BUN12_4050 [Bacillus amyloliquefaciens]GLW43430.1 hypothetical protein Bamy01_30750 [Bacillus amyloliquefaciens]